MQLLKDLDAERPLSYLAKECNFERTTVTKLKRDKKEIISIAESNKDLNQQRKPFTDRELLEKSLLIWFQQSRSKNIPISCPILLEKAIQLQGKFVTTSCLQIHGWSDLRSETTLNSQNYTVKKLQMICQLLKRGSQTSIAQFVKKHSR